MRLKELLPWLYTQPRDNDFHLMNVVLRSSIPQEDKEIFNRVRLNLKLLTATDIVNIESSTKISKQILKGKNYWMSVFNWPNVVELPKQWYEVFQMVLRQVIQPQLNSTPLGKWNSHGHQRLNHFICTSTHSVITMEVYNEMNDIDKSKYIPAEYYDIDNKICGSRN